MVAEASPRRLRTHYGRVKGALVDQLGSEAEPGLRRWRVLSTAIWSFVARMWPPTWPRR